MSAYQNAYRQSVNDPQGFWLQQSRQIKWFKPPQVALENDANGIERWFPDGELNTAYLALDYHVEQGRGDQTALIYDAPVTGKKAQYSYEVLRDQVAKCAGMLASLGVEKGDRVIIYMPMIPQAAIAMLACARLGAIHSVVFGALRRMSLRCASKMRNRKCC